MLSKSFEVESPWGKAHKESADFESFERLETRDRHRDIENKRNVVLISSGGAFVFIFESGIHRFLL